MTEPEEQRAICAREQRDIGASRSSSEMETGFEKGRQRITDGDSLSRRSFLGVAATGSLGAVAGCTSSEETDEEPEFGAGEDTERLRMSASEFLDEGTLYKTPNCSCCLEYTEYLETTTDASIETVGVSDLAVTKEEYGVPEDVESCHTLDVGQYFIEGHVPREAIGKLAEEQPDIAGIALPEMPLGSPGMPGEQKEAFVIYAVAADQSYTEFMQL